MSVSSALPVINGSTPESTKPTTSISIPPLLGASVQELTAWVVSQGQPAFRGKQLHDWIYNKGVRSLTDISAFSKQWRAELANIPIGRSTEHFRSVASDGTIKYLLRLDDRQIVETVGIPSENRLTVCVSTQVGCPMACDFCATGKGGFKRNLTRSEIVDQVLTVQEDFQRRVSNIVFMGMGEPLLNIDNVLGAVHSINKDIGIGQRNLTVSTVGIRNRIREFAQNNLQVTLAVSLHAPNQKLREQLIPSARSYPIEDLMAECREYVQITGRRATFEYVMLAGVNDLPEHALELSRRLRGFQSHVNLIPYNPISEVDYQRPKPERIENFVKILKEHHTAVSVRYSRGLEADAACGQLRVNKIN
jgi:23S rRNA (adenine2503-C2)-methyltransferase